MVKKKKSIDIWLHKKILKHEEGIFFFVRIFTQEQYTIQYNVADRKYV
jgi:hypothetical protein